jgi:hypothetical protein
MIEIFVVLAYVATFTLLVGGSVYLFLTRKRGVSRRESAPMPKEALKSAERLSGKYCLSDLEKLLVELEALEAWGAVVELDLVRIKDIAQLILGVDKVELYSHNNGVLPDYLERYRRSVEGAGLAIHKVENVEDVFFVEIVGSWPQIAAVVRRLVVGIYGVDDSAEIPLLVFL